ncbi:MAG: TIGR03986 family CRISPR-associated RAMP protein [Clostridiales bacterium]|jgi:hypothetical protein|nr:TIGR03986 family CRISPR-associated RAMP protein [Clostridiales bacterium]
MSKYHITDEKFINPYNFVSIDENVVRGSVEYGNISGVISCELETLSPLFIPNTTRDKAFSPTYSHSYDFFSYEDLGGEADCRNNYPRPIIPGSSIRGAIRSAYEALTNGCMSSCDDENTLYRRTPVPRKSFGIIEKDTSTGERVLYKAAKWKLPIRDRAGHQTGEILRGGVYLRGENFNKKKNDAIMKYELDKDGNKIEIARFFEDSREWLNLTMVWRLYQDRRGAIKGVNQASGHSGYRNYLNAEAIPVYFAKLDNGSFYYFAPAAITKEVFARTLKELLKKQGGHTPCDNGKNVCAACQLFGMVGEESIASRLMFHDATPIAAPGENGWKSWYEPPRVPPILSSPKVTATEFYMNDVDGAAYFNYDYIVNYYDYIDKDGKPASAAVRSFLDNPKLRGRKFYLHRKNVLYDNTTKFPNQQTEIRPVTKSRVFRLDISFDRLKEEELETLLWVLTFGEHNTTHAHKLGAAKPYGYGSVRITKVEVSLMHLKDDLSLGAAISADYKPKPPPSSTALREYLKLTDYANATDDVKYPEGDNGHSNGIYQWFGINKEIRSRRFDPSFNYVLPKALDDPYLPGYAPGNGPVGGNRATIQQAATPEAQSDIPMPQTLKQAEPKGATIGDRLNRQVTRREPKKTDYTAEDIRIWRKSLAYNKDFKKRLAAFVADYEKDPEYYKAKGLQGSYESSKGKL